MTNYVERASDRVDTALGGDVDGDKLTYYTLLVLAKGENITAEDVHHADSLYDTDSFRDPVKFEDLSTRVVGQKEKMAKKLAGITSVNGPDVPKLRTILRSIHSHPENWDQSSWANVRGDEYSSGCSVAADNGDAPDCGTTMCFAGWDAFMYAPAGSVLDVYENVIKADGTTQSISSFAREDLNLTSSQTEILFYGSNSLSDLESMVDELESNPEADEQDLIKAALKRAKSDQSAAERAIDRWEGKLY